jgi:serine/threonine protein kinase
MGGNKESSSDADPSMICHDNDSALVESMVGATVGKYEILSELGRGGTGVVYLARQRDLEREVALKALHGASGGGTGLALVAESRIAGSLNHPNIVTVYEYLGEEGVSYIAMEYVPRGSLRLWMGYLSLAQLAGVLEGVLAGLAAVEPRGIVHRDLKPENLMVTDDGRIKIADFGIAKATQTAGVGFTSGSGEVTVGTPAYMAPEQALCEEVGPWTDLYSVGVIAYEYLLGYVPFHDTRSPMGMLLRRIKDPIPAPADLDERVDESLSDWVTRLLVREPTDRVSSATTAWEELEEIVIGLLGPRWRRDARLIDVANPDFSSKPLTPTHFVSQQITLQTIAPLEVRAAAMRESTDTQRRPKTRRGSRMRLRLTAVAGLILAMAAGFGVARTVHSATAGASSGPRAAYGDIAVSLPSGWRAGNTASPTPHYAITAPVTLIPPRHTGSLTVGLSQATSAALLPHGMTDTVHRTPKTEAVSLRGNEFFRYPAVVLGAQTDTATIYMQPTTAGVLVGVCRLPTHASTAVNAGCEQILGTLELPHAHPLPLTQSARYATSLAATLDTFEAQRLSLTRALIRARSPRKQATEAGRLSHLAHESAAALRTAEPGSSEHASNAALVDVFDRVESGYAQMSEGARAEQAATYKAGARAVAASAEELRGALARIASSD